jgi:hypothetical protein
MHRWWFVESSASDCGAEEHTMRHIGDQCPLRLYADGLTATRVLIWFGNESLTSNECV